ncbi:MAG: hypothetical protein BGO98_11255 [Myxococcales bacterium 68-20]|nr:MAG: hypothetical protein BGO98_11255 [Myxococcales bacterium 68-20]
MRRRREPSSTVPCFFSSRVPRGEEHGCARYGSSASSPPMICAPCFAPSTVVGELAPTAHSSGRATVLCEAADVDRRNAHARGPDAALASCEPRVV